MKLKAEVLESLRELVRVLLVEREFQKELAGAAVDVLADDLCDEPEPKKVVGTFAERNRLLDSCMAAMEPSKKIVGVPVEEVAYLGEVGPVVPAKDPTDSSKPEYFLWVGRGKDGPSVTFERLLKHDYLMAEANPLRLAPNSSWRGRRLRVTFTDVTDGEPMPKETWSSWPEHKSALKQGMALAWQEGYNHRDQRIPGGYANNPYHEKYQGFAKPVAADTPSLAAPESWQEERAALVEECERRREQTKKLRGELDTVTAALKGEQGRAEALAEASRRSRGDLEMANDLRRNMALALGLDIGTGRADLLARAQRGAEALKAAAAGATTWQWQEWGRTIVGGIGDSGLELFEAVKQEVAILLETSRANERNAREAQEALEFFRSR